MAAREARFLARSAAGIDHYEVSLWGSRPGIDDDCWTSEKFETLAEARDCFDDPWSTFSEAHENAETAYVALTRNYLLAGRNYADELGVWQNPGFAPRLVASNNDWRTERAMQAGMGLGVQAYNDEMGY